MVPNVPGGMPNPQIQQQIGQQSQIQTTQITQG